MGDCDVPFSIALVSGGFAGTCVDVTLFPIDTLKTRLQSPVGFMKAGGFKGIYNGVGAAAIGSAPGAALFFGAYEGMKPIFSERFGFQDHTSHMAAACIGEAAACLVRVPTEVIKAKMQTSQPKLSLSNTVSAVLAEKHSGSFMSGILGGLYRGYGITLFREIPFAMIQFPLYERSKKEWSQQQGEPVGPFQAATCGSLSGAIAAGITTPLDVIKTRLMLGADSQGRQYKGVTDVATRILNTEGHMVFWSGVQPRVMWISIGGFVFFGAYEAAKATLLAAFM